MAEVVGGILGRNSGERFGESMLEGGDRAGLEGAQLLFNLCPAFFDRVEIGRVRRQVTERGAGLFNEIPDAIHFMGSQIVHDDELAGLQLRAQDVFEISPEDIAVGGCFDRHRSHPSGNTDRPQHRQCPPASGRNPFFDARAVPRASITPGHFCGDTALVNEDEPRRIDLSGFLPPELALRFDSLAVLLGGVE